MRTENIAYLLAVAAAFASCTKETAPEILISQDPVHEVCLKVGIEGSEDGTRTIVQSGGSVVWNYNEESISVFTAPGTQWKFTKKPGSGPTAEFTGGFSGSPSSYVAVYPYSEDNDMQAGSSAPGYGAYDYCITSSILLQQEAMPGTFSMGIYPMATAAATNSFTMYGLAGGISLPLKEDGVVKCIIVRSNSGEILSGTLTAGLSLADPVPGNILMTEGSDKVILCDAWRGTPLRGGTWTSYLAVLPPTTLSKGFTIFFIKNDGTIVRVATDKEINIKRATFSRIANLDEKMEAPVTVEPVDLGLSVKWSPYDLGTLDPWDTGLSYSWGMINLRRYSEDDYSAPASDVLQINADIAHETLGGEWRMPTREEFQELKDKCTWVKTSEGWKVTSKINGKSIVIPDAPHWTATKSYEFRNGTVSACDDLYAKKFIRPVTAPSKAIAFADATLKSVLVAAFDANGDGELSELEAATVEKNAFTSIDWGDKSRFTSFDEFRFFTGMKELPDFVFNNWTNLVSIALPASASEMPYQMLKGCTSLTHIDIPASIKEVGGFMDCSSLKSIVLPEGVEALHYRAFQNCSNLESITFPGTIKEIGGASFWGCVKLNSVYAGSLENWMNIDIGEEGHPFNFTQADEAHLYIDGALLTSVNVPAGITVIKPQLFRRCRDIKSVTIHDNVTEVGRGAFMGCFYIEDLHLGKGIQKIESDAFRACWNIPSLDLPEGLVSIGDDAFDTCIKIQSVRIPSTLKYIGAYAFSSCGALSNVYLPSLSSWLAVEIDLYGTPWSGLLDETPLHLYISGVETTSIEIPEGVSAIGNYSFYACKSITSVTIPSSVKSIGEEAFYMCPSLESVSCAEGLESIGNSAFYACKALFDITLPSSLKTIGDYTFGYCSALKTIVIPENVSSIGRYAFISSKGLTSVYLMPVTPPAAGQKIFDGLSSFPVYVPAASVSAYKSASGWSTYSSWIKAYPD